MGQSKEDFKVANNLFDQGEYIEGKEKFSTLLALDQTSADLNFKYGACLLYADVDKLKGLGHLQYAIKDPTIDPRAYYFIGKAYHLNYRFQDAIKAYTKFKSSSSVKQFENLNVDQEIKMCNNGKKLLRNISELVVIEKKEVVFNRVQYSYDLQNIGGKILVTDEFQTKYDAKIGHRPLVHFPSTRKDNIFFSSYGKEGETGKDIYQIKKLPNGNWSQAQKLPIQVNTDTDEDYGFLHPDGMTFYFCSKGHTSMGGYDVFRCSYDSEYNTFGPAQNLDFKINTPDDDILYIVDSLNKEAYFASTRSSKGGYVDVYNVRVEIYPILNAIIAGRFQNDITPLNKGIVMKVKDVVRDEIIGVYNSKSESGKFVIILPKSGKYQYIVESPESEKIHTGLFEVPYQKELRPLKQKLELINDGTEEQLVITNLFDEDVENADVIMADVLKQISDVEQNADQLEPIVDTTSISVEDTLLGIISEEDLIALADTMAVETARESNELKEKRDVAYFVANEKMKSARENAQKAEAVLKDIERIDNPQEKQQLLDLANEYNTKSKEDNEVAAGALNLGNTLDVQYEKKRIEADQAQNYANDIKAAFQSSSPEQAISKLEELKSYVEESRSLDIDDKSEFEKITEKARLKQAEATASITKAKELRNEEEEIRQELRNLDGQLKTASKKEKENVQLKIDEANELLVQTEKDADKAFAFAKEVQKDADVLNSEAKVLSRLFDDLADVEATVLTAEEKTQLSAEINSGEIISSIESNNTILASNQVEETELVETTPTRAQELKDRVAKIMQAEDNTNYDSIRESLSELPDGPEKTALVKDANESKVQSINDDIAIIDEALTNEENEQEIEKLLERKNELQEEGNKLQNDIAENESIDNNSETTTPNAVNEIVSSDDYNDLAARKEEAETIADPVAKAKAKEEITDLWIADLKDDLIQLEDLSESETDVVSKEKYKNKAEELRLQLTQKEDEKAELKAIISSSSSVVETTDDNSSNAEELNTTSNSNEETVINNEAIENNSVDVSTSSEVNTNTEESSTAFFDETKYDDYETKVTGLSAISDPVDRANAEIELKEEWVDALDNDIELLSSSLTNADDERKDEIQNQLDVLSLQKIQLQDEIAASEEKVALESSNSSSNPLENRDVSDNSTMPATDQSTQQESSETIVEPTADFSYTDEKEFVSPESSTAYSRIKEDVEELNDEQLKLEAMKMDLEIDPSISDNKKEKLLAQIKKQEDKVIEREIEVSQSYVDIHLNEKNTMLQEIGEAEQAMGNSALIDEAEIAQYTDEVAAVQKAFKEASGIRETALNETDKSVKNLRLKEAAAIEDGALNQLKSTVENYNQLVETMVDNEETTSAVTAQPSVENQPAIVIEETSLANTEAYNSNTSQEVLTSISEDLTDINDYNSEIEVLELQKENSTEKENKKLDKKISKIETKKAKIEVKVAPEIARANDAEFEQNKVLNEELKTDINALSNTARSSVAYADATNYERTANQQFKAAQKTRENAADIKDVSVKNDSLKKANDLEKVAIKNMASANLLNLKAAEIAAAGIYPEEGENNIEKATEKLVKQRNVAAELSNQGNSLIMEASALSDSAANVKNQDLKNQLLTESEVALRKGEQKKALAVQMNRSADITEEKIEDDVVLASLTTENVRTVKESSEYQEAHSQYISELMSINNLLSRSESLVPQLRTSAANDRERARNLIRNSEEANSKEEKQNLLDQAQELEEIAASKELKADSVETGIGVLEIKKQEVYEAQDNYLTAMPNQDLAKMIKAVGRSAFNKEPIVESMVDPSSIASANFVAPDKIVEDIVVLDNNAAVPIYTEENPIPINPKMPQGLFYRVQVGAFAKPIKQDLFKGFAPLTGEVIRNNITRYRVGYFTRYQTANETKKEIRKLGFEDAFVVAVNNGEPVRIATAKTIETETLGEAPLLTTNSPASNASDVNNSSSQNNPIRNSVNNDGNSSTSVSATNSTELASASSNGSSSATSYYEVIEDAPNAQPIEVVKGLFYTVQIGAYNKRVKDADLFNIQPLNVKLAPNGLLRYSSGRYQDLPTASIRKEEIKQIGVRDAFITVYNDGERITFAEARSLIETLGDRAFSDSRNDGGSIESTDSDIGVEGLEYIIDIGTFDKSVPSEVAEALLPNSSVIVREFISATKLKLTSGPLKTKSASDSRKNQLDKAGVISTSIRAMFNGEEISLEEAAQIEKQ
ncbi:hypothetical protein N9M27_01635 [Flavobacteriales bacterium]|nr:hypothetical protein [Flavobacteriales bacterium]